MTYKFKTITVKEVTCDSCGYVWNTKSIASKISCPSCLKKISVVIDDKIAQEQDIINIDKE